MQPDTRDRAQRVGRVDLGVEGGDAAVEFRDCLEVADDDADLESDLRLQLGEIDVAAVKREGVTGGPLQAIDERVDKRAGMRVVAAGVLADEAGQGRPPGLQDSGGIDPALQQCEGEPGAQIGQDGLEAGRGPADKVEQAALGPGDGVLEARPLLVRRCSAWLFGAGMWTGSKRGPPNSGMAPSTWASARSVLACSER